MNQYEKNKAYFQETFEEVHAPEGLYRKVKNMTKAEGKKIGMSVAKKLAVAAAIAAVLFAGSNGVAYATTGSTWVETVVAKLNVNGMEQNIELEGEVLEDGTVQYSGSVDVQDGATVEFSLISDAKDADSIKIDGNGTQSPVPEYYIIMDATTTVDDTTKVLQENDKIYFVDGDVKMDVTEDMMDGIASGSYEKNGVIYQYEIKEEPGVPGCYELHISSEEE